MSQLTLLVGGTPCQSFSIAGLRGGLADGRGNLALEYLKLADRARPRWLVWENVPGVLSSGGGRDFGSILGGMVELGYGVAYRVLDAQFVRVDGFWRAVPQRRRRVFVVGYLGDWRRAAAVLFERASLLGDPAPSRKAGQTIAPAIAASAGRRGGTQGEPGAGLIPELGKVSTKYRADPHSYADTVLAFGCKDYGQDARDDGVSPTLRSMNEVDGHQNGGGQVAIAIQERAVCENPDAGPDGVGVRDDGAAYTLEARTVTQAVAFESRFARNGRGAPSDVCPPLKAQSGETGKGDAAPLVATGWSVRRLTPRECERLQGFPDDHTLVPYRGRSMADGPRYKMCGNSMPVNVMRWIGRRIDAVEALA
jgi:DNA (cytosine-5)-methyltransferase 1